MRLFRAGVIALAAACNGGKSETGYIAPTETGTTATTTTTGSTGSGTPITCNYPATWAGIQDFFVANCDTCHATAYGAARLDLRAAVEEDIANGGGVIVLPGDAEGSDLWRDIAGESFTPMPTQGLLPEAEICEVRLWIDAGASLE